MTRQQWLEMEYEESFFTNKDLLENSDWQPKEWFNPFTELEKLAQHRQDLDMKPKHWRQYCIDNYPGIDATEQFRIRKGEVGDKFALQRASNCRKIYYTFDACKGEFVMKQKPPCKEYKLCSNCNEYAKEKKRKELFDFIGLVKMLEVSIEDEKKIARQLKSKYETFERIPIGDNKTVFLIKTDDNIGKDLSREDCTTLANHSVNLKNRRVTGCIVKPDEDTSQDVSNKEKIIQENIAIDFKAEGILKGIEQLNKVVQSEVKIITLPQTRKELQRCVILFQETAKQICNREGLSYKILDKTVIYYDLSDIDWQWLENKLILDG